MMRLHHLLATFVVVGHALPVRDQGAMDPHYLSKLGDAVAEKVALSRSHLHQLSGQVTDDAQVVASPPNVGIPTTSHASCGNIAARLAQHPRLLVYPALLVRSGDCTCEDQRDHYETAPHVRDCARLARHGALHRGARSVSGMH